MREIKFRARRADTGAWVYGDLTHAVKINTKEQADESGRRSQPVIRVANYDVDENTIGQFTGLRDYNAKEIYEGDILKYTDDGGRDHIRFVVFDAGAFSFGIPNSHTYTSMSVHLYWRYAIIGNTHDNPDLLTAEK